MEKQITRRHFSAGLLATSALAATRSFGAAKRGANERIRVGVIGCRNRGWQNAIGFQRSGQFEVVTLCDVDQAMIDQAMKKIQNCKDEKARPSQPPKLEKDFRRVLDDAGIDAIVNATPDHWHALITLHALQAGKHVYLEKPASYCINEGKAMVAAQRRHPNLVICVGTQQRSGQHFKDARAFIAEGGLGKVGFARAWIVHQRPVVPKVPDSDPPATLDYDLWLGPAPWRPYNKERVHYNWHFMRDTGTGDTGNWAAHWLDSIRQLLDLDLPTQVSGHGGIFVVHDAKEWHDTQTVVYEYPDLTVLWELRIWSKFNFHQRSCGAEIHGEKGSLVISRAGWTFHPKEGEPVSHRSAGNNGAHVRNFADCIRGQAKPVASIETGHKSAVLCHLANMTCTLNRPLHFDVAKQQIKGDTEANAMMGREYRSPWALPS